MDSLLLHFKKQIWDYYEAHGRSFEWRHVDDPYLVVVSEIMLQQTQTQRVSQKFGQFIAAFPTIESLAQASLQEVLFHWQGLGYNRRGMYLHKIAQKSVAEHQGTIPNDPALLVTFPGIGPATAASICAFAFNRPTIFIETNIRAVFIHSFFIGKEKVHDKEILPLVQATIDSKNPREWYYALMDYGVMLKKATANPSRKSVHHTQQSKFEGSDRQIRGMIIKYLSQEKSMSHVRLLEIIQKDEVRIKKALDQLITEGMITFSRAKYMIT